MKTIEAVVVILIVALGASLVLNYSLYTGNQQLKSEFNRLNGTELIFPLSASATNESLGLNFDMAINTTLLQSGQTISITLNETNTIPRFNNVTASDNWPYAGFPEQICIPYPGLYNLPFALAIVQGYHSKSDLNGTTSLPILSPPNIYAYCLYLATPSEYDFYPSSNVAFVHGGTFFQNMNESISTSMSFSGYYNSSSFSSETINFSPGVYTVIGGDEWGQLVLLHFVVS
jgi:hypothetical protein